MSFNPEAQFPPEHVMSLEEKMEQAEAHFQERIGKLNSWRERAAEVFAGGNEDKQKSLNYYFRQAEHERARKIEEVYRHKYDIGADDKEVFIQHHVRASPGDPLYEVFMQFMNKIDEINAERKQSLLELGTEI